MNSTLLKQIAAMSRYAVMGFFIQCFCISLLVAKESNAQDKSVENIYLTIHLKKSNIEKIFDQIGFKTQFDFVYSNNLLEKKQKISIHADNKSLGDVLRDISKKSGLRFRRVDQDILVSLKSSRLPDVVDVSYANDFVELEIKGRVTDEMGEPLPGVNIIVKGTTKGTVTDTDGKFRIELTPEEKILMFSSIGYHTQEIDVSNMTDLEVTLLTDLRSLENVVVVGYGIQEKVNLTGSVETIEGSKLAIQPVFQTSTALAGLAPGLVATQTSGQPGRDDATLRIRGIGTLGNGRKNNPLILVDGIPEDINGIDANNIESISILKDASAAAIYGSRAANGVILITTKRGKSGALTVDYNNYFGVQRIAQNLEFEDGLGFIKYRNIAEPGSFDQSFIDDYTANRGTDEFPDTDWVKEVFSENGFQQYHNISVRGGSESIKLSGSISYQDQDGNIPNYNFKRYNGRFNTDIKLNDKLGIVFDLNFRKSIREEPTPALDNITRQAYRIQPLFSAINSDGSFGPGWNGLNPVAGVLAGGLTTETFNYFRGLIKATYRPIQDLDISLTYAPQFRDNDLKAFTAQYEWKDVSQSGVNPIENSLTQRSFNSFQDNLNVIATYSRQFSEHAITGTAGYEFLKFRSDVFSASRRNFILQEFQQLSTGDANTQLNSGSETLNALESVFGRINYSYKGKYLFEANIRRDASSRFAPENRVSIFPSFSVGWRMAEDLFPSSTFVDDLKLRASWGQLGNQFIFDNNGNPINFAYVSLFGVGNANPIIGDVPVVGGAQTVLSNQELQWETAETTNFGVDASLLSGRLSFTIEYYIRKTKDILLNVTVPPSIGLLPPTQNAGEVENKGWDLSFGWNDNIGEVQYGANFNFSTFKNTITDLNGLEELPPGNTIDRLGEAIGSIYGLQVLGFYPESDFDGSGALNAELPFPQFGPVAPGDLKYADLTNDGIINNNDRTIIGNSQPRLNYGFDLFAYYKGFDLSMSFLGVGNRDIILQGDVAYPFFNAGKIQTWQTDSWTPQNTNASNPRFTPGSNSSNWRTNTQWLFDASYFRMRNLTLGYSFSNSLIDRIGLSRLRVFVSGQNIFTIDNLPEGIDPLVPNFSSGAFYPVTSVFTTGLNISFQ